MTFLIGEIALWLLGAAVLGVVLGAVLSRPRRAALQSAKANNDGHTQLAQASQQRLDAAQRRINDLEDELAEAKVDRGRLANLEAQLRAAHNTTMPQAPSGWSAVPPSAMAAPGGPAPQGTPAPVPLMPPTPGSAPPPIVR
jgi:hypothetical protein